MFLTHLIRKGSDAMTPLQYGGRNIRLFGMLQGPVLHSCVAIANRSSYHVMEKTLDYI